MSTARILVVDDEADIRDLVQEILSEEGYAVEGADQFVGKMSRGPQVKKLYRIHRYNRPYYIPRSLKQASKHLASGISCG